MVKEIEGEVCWIHVFEHGVEIKVNKYFFKPEDYLANPEVFLSKDELEEFPILRCNELYVTTSETEYYGRKRFFKYLRKVLSKIEKNWVGRKTPLAPIFVPPEEIEEEMKKYTPTIIKRYRR